MTVLKVFAAVYKMKIIAYNYTLVGVSGRANDFLSQPFIME